MSERVPSGQQLVEQDTEREQVGAAVERLAPQLLGRHVLRRAHPSIRARAAQRRPRVRRLDLGDAEVEHLPAAGGRPHHVLGLRIAVHDPLPVRGAERVQHGEPDGGRVRRGQRPVGELLAQRRSRQALLDDVQGIALVDERVHGGDVRMTGELRHQLRLVLQAATVFRITRDRRLEGLDCDLHVEPDVTREVDDAHTARGDEANDGVAANLRTWWQQRRIISREQLAHHASGAGCALGGGDELGDIAGQVLIPAAQLPDQRRPARGLCLQHLDEDVGDARGCGVGHAARFSCRSRRTRAVGHLALRPSSSRRSHALASVQRRLMVAGNVSS